MVVVVRMKQSGLLLCSMLDPGSAGGAQDEGWGSAELHTGRVQDGRGFCSAPCWTLVLQSNRPAVVVKGEGGWAPCWTLVLQSSSLFPNQVVVSVLGSMLDLVLQSSSPAVVVKGEGGWAPCWTLVLQSSSLFPNQVVVSVLGSMLDLVLQSSSPAVVVKGEGGWAPCWTLVLQSSRQAGFRMVGGSARRHVGS
ncbi:unnamed protein product [Boreogadus saida]